MHGQGVLHRDVKPSNVFFDGFWNAFLGDFGIAKVLDQSGGMTKEETLTDTRFAIGTPEYMAPEMFLPKAVPDGRSDQYALAVDISSVAVACLVGFFGQVEGLLNFGAREHLSGLVLLIT
jgi:serine/threonine protein kinase